jgi:hypothetical protein
MEMVDELVSQEGKQSEKYGCCHIYKDLLDEAQCPEVCSQPARWLVFRGL